MLYSIPISIAYTGDGDENSTINTRPAETTENHRCVQSRWEYYWYLNRACFGILIMRTRHFWKKENMQKVFIFLSVYPAGTVSDWERLLPRFNIIPLSTIPSLFR